MKNVTNANISGNLARQHKDLFRRVLAAVQLDATGLKISVIDDPKAGAWVDGNKVILPSYTSLYKFITTFVAKARHARINIDLGEEFTAKQRNEIGRAYAEERLEQIRNVLTLKELEIWDVQIIEAREAREREEKEREKEIAARPDTIIGYAKKREEESRKKKLEILEAMATNCTYEYSWRVEELGVVAYLEKHFATFVHFSSPENNPRMEAATTPEERVAVLHGMVDQMLHEEIRTLVRHRRWAQGGSPGSRMDEIAKATASGKFCEWLEDIRSETARWMGQPDLPRVTGW